MHYGVDLIKTSKTVKHQMVLFNVNGVIFALDLGV
jgi:hypothetical protein